MIIHCSTLLCVKIWISLLNEVYVFQSRTDTTFPIIDLNFKTNWTTHLSEDYILHSQDHLRKKQLEVPAYVIYLCKKQTAVET